jgi:DNA-binding transcriptional LysR family regulator
MQWEDRIGRRVKLQDMHILLATVQCGSMGKAATHLAISQPVVSRSIAGLEHALGVRLLDRTRGGVEPTIYGRALLNHGLAAFNELKHYADMRIMPSRWPFVLVNRPFRPGISA